MPCSAMSRWKPRFVITVTATWSTPRWSASTARIWSPSTGSPRSSTRACGRRPRRRRPRGSSGARGHERRRAVRVGRAAAEVDVRAVRGHTDRVHLGSAALEHAGRDVREGAVRAVDADAQTGEIRSEVREDVPGVLLAHPVGEALDRAAARRLRVEQPLDLLLSARRPACRPRGRTSRRCTRAGCARPRMTRPSPSARSARRRGSGVHRREPPCRPRTRSPACYCLLQLVRMLECRGRRARARPRPTASRPSRPAPRARASGRRRRSRITGLSNGGTCPRR